MRLSIDSVSALAGSSKSSSAPSGSTTSTARLTIWERVTTSGSVGMPRGLPENLRHTPLDRAAQGVADRSLLEALDELGHEALDHQALAHGFREPARAQVEQLLRVDLRDRRRVRAAHVVGEDLQAGDRVRVRALGQ